MTDVLVLNSTYEPLNVTRIARAVRLIFAGKAEVVESQGFLATVSFEVPLPSVIRMLYFVGRHRRKVPLSKRNVLLRDRYVCQYCGVAGDSHMTVDHVQPRSRGGKSEWANLVASCSTCNARKGSRTPAEARMSLRRKPYEPKLIPFLVVRKHTQPSDWSKYVSLWNVSIDERPG